MFDNETLVRWGEAEALQSIQLEPADLRVLEGRGIAGHLHFDESNQERSFRIAALEENATDRNHSDGELLSQLSLHGLEVRLPGVDLSAGKLPESSVPLVFWAPAQQNPRLTANDRCHDRNLVHVAG